MTDNWTPNKRKHQRRRTPKQLLQQQQGQAIVMPALHEVTFEHIVPTETQTMDMRDARDAARMYASTIDRLMPDGPDKTYVMRKLREIGMWVNAGITRHADGSPR